MKIAYVGNFEPVHSTENHIRKTLEKLGQVVMPIQENRYNVRDILERSKTADLFIYTRTWGLIGDGLWLLRRLEELGIPTVSYHLDLYFGLKRSDGLSKDPFWQTKYVFTPDGDHDEEFRKLGINHHYLKPGVFEDECYLGTPVENLKHDVIFVGSYDYHDEWQYRPKLIDWLRKTYGERFARYGNPSKYDRFTRVVRNEELNNLYASAKVVVGDSCNPEFKLKRYWSDRVYETLGRGGFLIHPEVEGLNEEFGRPDADDSILERYPFGDFDRLKELIDHYVENDDLRNSLRDRGHEFVKKNATYTHRIQEVFRVLVETEPKIAKEAAKQW